MTLTDIIGYLPYKILSYHKEGHICWIDLEMVARYGISLCNYRPVLRPMSDLIAEITEKGYNDGKPFVPIVELAKAWSGEPIPDYRIWQHGDFVGVETYSPNVILAWWLQDRFFDAWQYGFGFAKKEYHIALCNMHKAYDLLHRWHFDYRGLIEAGDAVNIHDLTRNPYE